MNGETSGLGALLQDPTLQYYVNSLAQGMMSEEHPMRNVSKTTQQQIATQNYMNLIKEMLAGGGKFSMDRDKFKLDAPSMLLGEELTGTPSGTLPNYGGGGPTMRTSSGIPQERVSNPSASPLDTSSASLAGLTPENISQALQLKQSKEALEQKSVSDIYDMMYKLKVLERTDPRPAKIQGYEYAVGQGFEGSYADFQNVTETAHKKDYDEAVKGGYAGSFNTWLLEMAKAGAINLGGIAEREVFKGTGKGQADVMSPDFSTGVRETLMKDRQNWPSESLIKKYTDKGLSYIDAEGRAQKLMVLEEMDKQIRQAFKGKKVTTEEDGWYVDGALKVRYP